MEEVRRNGSVSARYKYLADGTKLEVSDAMGCGFLYFGSLIYSKRGTIYTPESVGFTGGRIVCTSAGSEVLYHVTDYLGSVRVVADQNGRALEKINYYPFGKRWDAADQQLTNNRYLFNGKEWQATGAVNLLDYGARMYDANNVRWSVQDPKYQTSNPYSFCGSDPINRIDPNGMDYYFNRSGEYLFQDDSDTNFIRILTNDFLGNLWNLEALFEDNYDKLHAYSEFFSKVNLSDEAIKKIYTWIFTNFFPDFAFIPINLGDKMNPKTLMSTIGKFNDSHTEVINLHIDVNHTSAGMLTQLDNGLTIADNLYCILSVFDHETMHLLGWMENPLAYYYLGEVAQEYAAYRYQIFDSIYWGFAPPSFHIMIIGSYLKYNKKHSLKL